MFHLAFHLPHFSLIPSASPLSSSSSSSRHQPRMALQIPPPPPSPTSQRRRYRQTRTITWGHVEKLVLKLYENLQANEITKSPDILLSITRGGTIPAAMLSQRFEIRNLLSATVLFYTDDGQPFYGLTEPRFLNFPSEALLEGRNILIIDDVWDTGKTAKAVKNRTKRTGANQIHVACLHWKPKGGDRSVNEKSNKDNDGKFNMGKMDGPDFWAEKTDRWIVYPWEKLAPNGIFVHANDDDEGKHLEKRSLF